MEKILLYLAIGLTIGSISGALGIGGGILLIPILMWLYAAENNPGKASAMTLAVLAVPVTLPAVWRYYVRDVIHVEDLKVAAWIAAAFAVGSLIGASVQQYIPVSVLRLSLGLLMVYVAIRFIVNSQSETANAAAGLGAVVLAWLGYLGLRLLGRKHLPKPDLGDRIRASQQARGDIDYQI